jgi:hypothetical protein
MSIKRRALRPTATGIRLVASANVRQVHSLEVGAVTETIEVEGAPPLVA